MVFRVSFLVNLKKGGRVREGPGWICDSCVCQATILLLLLNFSWFFNTVYVFAIQYFVLFVPCIRYRKFVLRKMLKMSTSQSSRSGEPICDVSSNSEKVSSNRQRPKLHIQTYTVHPPSPHLHTYNGSLTMAFKGLCLSLSLCQTLLNKEL